VAYDKIAVRDDLRGIHLESGKRIPAEKERGLKVAGIPHGKRDLRVFNPAGAAGLEPATPGFGDRCATNCATPLGCVTSVAGRSRGSCGQGVACGRATGRARAALLGDRGLPGARGGLVGPRGRPGVGNRGRGGRTGALDGRPGTSSLASPIARTALPARRNGRRTSYSPFVANLDESRPGGPCGA
jgi:hypothetical protein